MQTALHACHEIKFNALETPDDPLQNAFINVEFVSPSGSMVRREGFWDGSTKWRVRMKPTEVGLWHWKSTSNMPSCNSEGSFESVACESDNRFLAHGPVRVSESGTHFAHADGTPFFFLSDTDWYGALRAKDDDWAEYVSTRKTQQFTAVQFMASNWWAMPDDGNGQRTFEIEAPVKPNIELFRRLDRRIASLNEAGLWALPVMLWAAVWHSTEVPEGRMANPGVALSEKECIRIGRYMIARWGAFDVSWIIFGDGAYHGEMADRVLRVSRAIFEDQPDHAPATLHMCGVDWVDAKHRHEPWLSYVGYQSGHGDGPHDTAWLTHGPPAWDFRTDRVIPLVNLEPAYEDHVGYHVKLPHSARSVRRAIIRSLLNAPTVGCSYGGHGVWGWDDGTAPPEGHDSSGVAKHWRTALRFEGAQNLRHIRAFFESLPWTELRPAQHIVIQPRPEDPYAFVSAAASSNQQKVVIYAPDGGILRLNGKHRFHVQRYCPRTGQTQNEFGQFDAQRPILAPMHDDWLFLLTKLD